MKSTMLFRYEEFFQFVRLEIKNTKLQSCLGTWRNVDLAGDLWNQRRTESNGSDTAAIILMVDLRETP
jgi:hypothetical protein